MYLPNSFRQTDVPTMHQVIQQNSFATLVSVHEGLPFATHLPFYLLPKKGEYGTLIAHVARANPQWRSFADNSEVLIIFQGAHAYVSPSWYETIPSVPTWNYVAIHAYGKLHILEEYNEVHAMLKSLVDYNEAGFSHPWEMDLPQDYMQNMMKAIVGFEISITKLEGKFKLSQNRNETDQKLVAEHLSQNQDPLNQAVAELMHQNLAKS
jgi:transcriptional regulator